MKKNIKEPSVFVYYPQSSIDGFLAYKVPKNATQQQIDFASKIYDPRAMHNLENLIQSRKTNQFYHGDSYKIYD
jgi:hypothetical protein